MYLKEICGCSCLLVLNLLLCRNYVRSHLYLTNYRVDCYFVSEKLTISMGVPFVNCLRVAVHKKLMMLCLIDPMFPVFLLQASGEILIILRM